MSLFCCLGWDDHHLLPYVFRSLQGFLVDLAKNLGKDATLGNVLWTLDKHYGVMMTGTLFPQAGNGRECG